MHTVTFRTKTFEAYGYLCAKLSIKSSAAVDSVLPTFVAASESVPAVVDGELPHSLI